MLTVVFTMGIPASGKSTWSKAFCRKNKNWVRISRDDLRTMRGTYWIPKDERMISDWEVDLMCLALDHKKSVVIDATNFNKNWVKGLKELAKMVDKNVKFKTKRFRASLKTCIERDSKRDKPVGEKVIKDMYYYYIVKDDK